MSAELVPGNADAIAVKPSWIIPPGEQLPLGDDMPQDAVTRLSNAMWEAMGAEGIPCRTRRHVISRTLFGRPDYYEGPFQ